MSGPEALRALIQMTLVNFILVYQGYQLVHTPGLGVI